MELLDRLPCAVLVTDAHGGILRANAEMTSLAVPSHPGSTAATMDALLTPASRIFLQTHVWPTLLREAAVNEIYLQFKGAQEARVPVMANCKRAAWADGAAYFWTFFVVKERQRFEAALLDARTRAEAAARAMAAIERFTRSVTDSIPGLVAYWDQDLRCRFANKAYLHWFGRSPESMLGSHLKDLLGGQVFETNRPYVEAALAGVPQQFERSFTKADGAEVQTLVNYVPDWSEGRVAGFMVLANDVTQLKQTEGALRDEMAERERVHEQLRQSSASLQEAQRLGHIGSWSWRVADDAVTWSEETFRIFGLDPSADAPGFAAQAALYEPESFARLREAVDHCLSQGQPYSLELVFVRPDGVRGWIDARGEAVSDDQGCIERLRGSVQDISARKAIEGALARESLRLANIIDGTQSGTWEWNVQTGSIKLNERSAAMLGYTLAEPGLDHIDFRITHTHPEDHARSLAAARDHFAGRIDVYESESRMRHRDGHWVWVLARGRVMTRTPDGRPEWMFGTHKDITARKRDEVALRKSQEMLDRTEQLAGVGAWELDTASGELSWSAQTRRLHGVAGDFEPDLESALRFFPPGARDALRSAFNEGQAYARAWDLELPLQRADGMSIWVRMVGAAETDAGRTVRLFGAIQDVTRRHDADEALAQRSGELQRSNEELERFAYVASHDLQEPLRMVTSYGQLLQRRHLADLKPEGQEFMRFMIDGGQRAQALIRDLLSLARLDSQAQPWQPVPLQALLAEALAPLRLRVKETGATITHDALPTVEGDARQLGQLFANLLGNALKFSGAAPPCIHVGAVREGAAWRISVSDQGIGIEARYFERIFQMFQRLHLRSEYEGTGIGLAICKKVVERHGGRIGVESTPGRGTTFHFTLPDAARSGEHGAVMTTETATCP